MVKLRLKRLGRKKRPYYRIVAMDANSPRDGQALAEVGMYDPLLSKVDLDEEAALHWLNAGARMTGTVRALFKNQGLLSRWGGLEGTVTEGFLTLDKPKRLKKLAAAEAAASEPAAEAEETAVGSSTGADEPAAADAPAPAEEPAAAEAPGAVTNEAEAAEAPGAVTNEAEAAEAPGDEGDSATEA